MTFRRAITDREHFEIVMSVNLLTPLRAKAIAYAREILGRNQNVDCGGDGSFDSSTFNEYSAWIRALIAADALYPLKFPAGFRLKSEERRIDPIHERMIDDDLPF